MRGVHGRPHRCRNREHRFSRAQECSGRQKLQFLCVSILDVFSGKCVEELNVKAVGVASGGDTTCSEERHGAVTKNNHLLGGALVRHSVNGEEEMMFFVESNRKLDFEFIVELAFFRRER